MDEQLIGIGRAANILGICPNTLRTWEKQGKILSIKTNGGHRRYRIIDIENFLHKNDKINQNNS